MVHTHTHTHTHTQVDGDRRLSMSLFHKGLSLSKGLDDLLGQAPHIYIYIYIYIYTHRLLYFFL